jgi:hypothetical protein
VKTWFQILLLSSFAFFLFFYLYRYAAGRRYDYSYNLDGVLNQSGMCASITADLHRRLTATIRRVIAPLGGGAVQVEFSLWVRTHTYCLNSHASKPSAYNVRM